MKEYVFSVTDSDGFWGDIRVIESDENSAKESCATFLNFHEVFPNGSLDQNFTLVLKETNI